MARIRYAWRKFLRRNRNKWFDKFVLICHARNTQQGLGVCHGSPRPRFYQVDRDRHVLFHNHSHTLAVSFGLPYEEKMNRLVPLSSFLFKSPGRSMLMNLWKRIRVIALRIYAGVFFELGGQRFLFSVGAFFFTA